MSVKWFLFEFMATVTITFRCLVLSLGSKHDCISECGNDGFSYWMMAIDFKFLIDTTLSWRLTFGCFELLTKNGENKRQDS